MTNQPNYQPQFQTAPPSKRRVWPLVAGGVAALLVGVGIGSSQSEAAPAPEPAPTVTEIVETVVTAEPEPAPTVTVTAEAETVPQACLDAISDARDLADAAGDVSGLVVEHLEADSKLFVELADSDYSGMASYTAGLEDFSDGIVDITERVGLNNFNTNAAICEGKA